MTQSTANLPLSGLNVVELHAIGPVPFAGMLMRNLGATINRVSPPGDPALGVAVKKDGDLLNFGKNQLYVDLMSPAGMAELHKALEKADVLLEGFRPGVLERLGLAPATLHAKYPKLVIGRLSGWGTQGAWADRAGHDINYLALAGVLNAIGTAETPVPPLNLVADFGGGAMHLLVGVLAKVIQRSITGRGGVVEASILSGTVGLTPIFFGLMSQGLWGLKREANMLDGGRPYYRVYKTKDGRFMSVGAIEAKFYLLLLKMLGLENEIDPAKQNDPASRPTTVKRFSEVFATKTRDEWAALAVNSDACAAPVLDFAEAAKEGHNLANGLYVSEPFPKPGAVLNFTQA
ncbi:MAG: CoA transferase [Gemmatimonadetes bacterium]|nr:CoA transferase [Gemmatimonadota bacterium]